MSDNNTNDIGTLATPGRNNFFYGKLMDEKQFEKEQQYFIHRRALMNRFLLGSGVVAGLNIRIINDVVEITPGAAIDGLGREIIVPETVQVDPSVLTDEHGEATTGTFNDGKVVEICLQYREIKADPVPVFVPDCDNNGNCAASTIQEEFAIVVRAQTDTSVDADESEGLILSAAGIQEWFCKQVGESVIDTSEDVCVMLGAVTVGNPHVIKEDVLCEKKNLVHSNQLLFELIIALAKKIDDIS